MPQYIAPGAVIQAGGGVTSGLTRETPVPLTTVDATGNAYATQIATGNIREVVAAFTKDVVGDWWGLATVPGDYASAGKVVLSIAANATTGVTTMGVATLPVANGEVYDAALTAEADRDVAVPGVAYTRTDTVYTLTPVIVAGDQLLVRVRHNGTAVNDTLAVDTVVFQAVLRYTT